MKGLGDGHRRLQRVKMAHLMGLFGKRHLGVAAFDTQRARGAFDQPRDLPQEARLAAAIGAGQHQRLAGNDGEGKTFKDKPAAAFAGKIGCR